MSTRAADLLFRPRNVVVYGASSDPDKLSGRPLDYLRRFGFPGGIYAVNPRRDEVQGVRSYPDVRSVPVPLDLAVIVVPAASVEAAIRECGEAGVGAAIVFASGFAEVDEAGAEHEARIARAARESGVRLLGPNCLGSFAAPTHTFATFSTAFDDDGERPDSPVAIVSQSGAVGTFTYSTMTAGGMGVRYFANTGNEADLGVVELLDGLVDAADVEILMGHVEGVDDVAGVAALAGRASRAGKPLIVLHSGRTPAGARAVRRHTGSTAGDDAGFDAALAAHGAARVESLEAWADAALVFRDGRRAGGRRLSLVTQSGGAAAIATDRAVELGMAVDTWTDAADLEALLPLLPAFASVENPIDLTGAMINDVGLLRAGLRVTTRNAQTDAVLVVLGNTDRGAEAIVAELIAAYRETDKPFLVSWTGGNGWPRRALLDAGLPAYTDPVRAVRALGLLLDFSLRPTS